ncbi:MarR family transcriptional regulator [Sinomonas atrocyanea]|uniref:MarR family transcriptional regulator n=1 Tax=Sinomonas atrocyanea TaxID=37927 RepID=A0A127A9E8_9MICC|nr:MarR family transcriptional regulator [Sinomonas atrocyanea]AMM34312.1 MarR family transcriptional regulator [Sinomonas atrocyanea]GEB66397.1 transcriptional regulator [Sinomonas atrocyanea]GGG63577.1 transcriptional regulator [Sinomonas atrocyanea]
MEDAVEAYMRQWQRERPDLDTGAMGVIARLSRAGKLITASIRGNFAGSDLEPWEFDVLATLRRAGAPYTLTPKSLAGTSMVGGAAMTHRVDKLLRRGLVSREVDPANRRQLLVTLTPEGLALVDRLIVDHIEGAERFLHGLDPSEVHALDTILQKLLLARGDTAPLDQD